jgi:Phage capsid family
MRNQPIPLRLDPDRLERDAANSLSRAAFAFARHAFEPAASPLAIAKRTFGSDRAVEFLIRAAVSPAMTTTTGWADTFVTVANVFLASLTGPSAAADLFGRGLQVKFDGAGMVSLPTIATGSASFVGQGKPIPVTQYQTASGVKLEPHKLALIAVLTREMVESSNAQAIVSASLTEAAAYGLDVAVFSATAGSDDRPPGILNGVPAESTPSTASPLSDAMVADLATLGGKVARVAGSDVVFVAAPEQALAIALRSPDFGYPVLASRALLKGTVIAVAANAIVSGFDSVPVIEASREPELIPDTAPGEIVPAGGGFSGQTWSLFQSDRVGLKMRMEAAWALRSPNAIAWMSNVTW